MSVTCYAGPAKEQTSGFGLDGFVQTYLVALRLPALDMRGDWCFRPITRADHARDAWHSPTHSGGRGASQDLPCPRERAFGSARSVEAQLRLPKRAVGP